jgi:hypothetical protein
VTVQPYYVEKMLRNQELLREIMYPESVQVALAIISYLQSWEFFALIIVFMSYRVLKKWL